MIYTYAECLERWKTDYRIKQAVGNGDLFQIEKGLYSDESDPTTLAIISKKYPKSIVTLDTAFYYYGLTDVVPDEYYIATDRHARAVAHPKIKQVYVQSYLLDVGVVKMERRDATFNIYDRERLLIELLRYKNKFPYDYYKEILGNYRRLINELDIERIQEYAAVFPKSKTIQKALDTEVF